MTELCKLTETIGGVFLLLYGIHLMGVNIQKMLGSKLEGVLRRATGSPLRGLLTGAAITGAMNSSGTTIVMLFGLITGGLLTLPAAVPVMLGASIGSTVATQLASLRAGAGGMLVLILGVLIHLTAKRRLTKSCGEALIGLSFIFGGMEFLFQGVNALAKSGAFLAVIKILLLTSPLLALLSGIVLAFFLQSATVASIIAVALGAASLIDLPAAVYMILGINLGSSLKVNYLALRGENFSGKIAFIHLLFNLTGCGFALLFLPFFLEAVRLSPGDTGRQIANAHTLYNVFGAFLFLPLIPAAVRLSEKVSAGVRPIRKNALFYLDEKLVYTPSVSLSQVNRGAVEMAKISFEMLDACRSILFADQAENIAAIEQQEEKIDLMTEQMTEYSVRISQQSLSQADKMKLFSLLHVLADLEHLTDHIFAVSNLLVEMKKEEGTGFSPKAQRDLTAVFGKLKIMQNLVIKALEERNSQLAGEINRHENKVDEVIKKVIAGHQTRMAEGACSPAAGQYYRDILYNLERVGDYYDDIAFAITDSFRRKEIGKP